jgi:hypothetical protein
MTTSQKTWEKYAVDDPNGMLNNSVEFDEVSHVTHIANALDIVRDGKFTPRLVYDESQLNRRRILVNWLSPNSWAHGFRYGNIEFVFDLPELLKQSGVRFYWVEVMDYSPKACRILVTDRERQNLDEYDPSSDRGPWRWDRKRNLHYRNGSICLEIMLERELELEDCVRVEFVDHHQYQCSIDPRSCSERGLRADKAGALFISGLVAGKLSGDDLHMTKLKSDKVLPGNEIKDAWDELEDKLRDGSFGGKAVSSQREATPLARAILWSVSQRNDEDRRALSGFFSTADDLVETCAELVAKTFELSNPQKLLE